MLKLIVVLFAGIAAATGFMIWKGRVRGALPRETLRVKEISVTALLGAMLWLEAGTILYYGFTEPEHLITSGRAWINMLIFLTLSILAGSFMLLYYFVKCIILTEDGVTGVSWSGKRTVLSWAEIDGLSLGQGKRLTLSSSKTGERIVVGGEKGEYKEAVKVIFQKLPSRLGVNERKILKEYLHL